MDEQRVIRSAVWPLRIAWLVGILVALGLVRYGQILVPGTSNWSLAAVTLVLVLYGVVGWIAPVRICGDRPAIWSMSAAFGIVAGLVFTSEIALEYVLLPTNNARMGFVEFGLVWFIYALAGTFVAGRPRSVRAGTMAAVATAMISSLIWLIAVLATFFCFFGTERQRLVFLAEGNYDDFARSGMADFHTFVMEDFFGAGFYHLLLGPLIAAALGALAGRVTLWLGALR